jgi:hypothetical protein
VPHGEGVENIFRGCERGLTSAPSGARSCEEVALGAIAHEENPAKSTMTRSETSRRRVGIADRTSFQERVRIPEAACGTIGVTL